MRKDLEPIVVAEQRSGPGHVRAKITGIRAKNGDLLVEALTGDERGHRVCIRLPFPWLLAQLPKLFESENTYAQTEAIAAHRQTRSVLRARHADAIVEGMLNKIYGELKQRFEVAGIESWDLMMEGTNALKDEKTAAELVAAASANPKLLEPTETERLLVEHLTSYECYLNLSLDDAADSLPTDLAGFAESYDGYDNPAAGLRARDELRNRVKASS